MDCFHSNTCLLLHVYLIKCCQTLYKQIIIPRSQNIEDYFGSSVTTSNPWPTNTLILKEAFVWIYNRHNHCSHGWLCMITGNSVLALDVKLCQESEWIFYRDQPTHRKRPFIPTPLNRVIYGLLYTVHFISYAYSCITSNVIACIFIIHKSESFLMGLTKISSSHIWYLGHHWLTAWKNDCSKLSWNL